MVEVATDGREEKAEKAQIENHPHSRWTQSLTFFLFLTQVSWEESVPENITLSAQKPRQFWMVGHFGSWDVGYNVLSEEGGWVGPDGVVSLRLLTGRISNTRPQCTSTMYSAVWMVSSVRDYKEKSIFVPRQKT